MQTMLVKPICPSAMTKIPRAPSRKTIRPQAFKQYVPVHIQDKIRVVEVANGRLATVGLAVGATIGNFQGKSFGQQFDEEKVLVAVLIAAMYAFTTYQAINGYEKKQQYLELKTTRMAMIFMTLLFGMEVFIS